MSEAVVATISARVAATLSGSPPEGSAQHVINESVLLQLNGGTGVGNSDCMITKAINIAASGNTTIDLTGAAVDALGVTVAMADVQCVLIEADPTNVNDIVMGGGSNPWLGPVGNQTLSVHPGGVFLEADKSGWAVTAATGDILKLANSSSGTAVTGKITVIGRSA